MSLSNQDIESLKKRLNNNRNLTPRSKTNLNAFINNKKNAFNRSTFIQQYNAKMRNLRSRDASIGKRKRSPSNLNSAMENSSGSVSGGSVNPGKRGRNSPRGPLSAVSGASNTSNNENNASTNENLMAIARQVGQRASENILERNAKRRKNNSQPPLITAAQAASRAANAKAAANKVKANAVRNRVPLVNLRAKRKAAAAAAQVANKVNANAKAAANKAKANANAARARVNANAKAAVNKAKANANAARARANTNAKAKAVNISLQKKITNPKNIEDVINFLLSRDQLLEIAKNLDMKYKSKITAPAIKKMVMDYKNKAVLFQEVNKQLVGGKESNDITKRVNSYISSIQNNNRTRPGYTASLVILYIKDLPSSERQRIIAGGSNSILPQLMNGINRRTMSTNKINFVKSVTNEQFTDLVFIMWLDGVHDKYITKTLDVWFNETTLFTSSQKKLIVKGWKTAFIATINGLQLPKGKGKTNILTSSLNNFSGGWEKGVKEYITTKYKSNINEISTSLGKQVITNTPQNINIAIDQQYKDNNEFSMSRFISNHKKPTDSKTDVNTLITYGQAFDPGRSMVIGGVHQDIEMLSLKNLPKNFISSKKKYYLCDINIDLKVGNTSVYNLQVKKDPSNNLDVNFNNKKLFTNISAGQAGKAKGDVIAVSKYFGDALQYYSLAVMDDVQRSSKTERFFFGSGDSMALLGYDRVCEIFNKKIRMVIDFPNQYQPRIYVVGMNANVRNQPQVSASMMTGTGIRKNNKNGEVTSK